MARKIEDVAWAAGLFEGEGSCFVGSGQRQPIVSLVMTDEDVVRRFARILGVGNVHSYATPPRKRYWRWSVQSKDDVLVVLGLLFPFLGERRAARAAEVIERATKMTARNGLRTHCKRGHAFADPGVLYIHKKTGKRYCRRCRLDYLAERRRVSRLAA